MTPAKRKAQQDSTKPEEQETLKKVTTPKRKPKREETMMQLREPQDVETQPPSPALTINIQSWATPIVGIVMLVIGALAGFYARPVVLGQLPENTSGTSPAVSIPTPDQSESQQRLMASLIPRVRHFTGDPNAPVTIIEFGDYQCPFCGRHATTVGLQIDQQYIRSGKVRFGYWNFAFLGSESTWSAEAAECAADQDQFWAYHDKLYDSQSGENQGAFSKDNLKRFAEEIGLNTQVFNECLDSGKYTSLIQEDTQASQSLGVQSTPTFLVNGQPVIGAQPFEVFQQAIESFLK